MSFARIAAKYLLSDFAFCSSQQSVCESERTTDLGGEPRHLELGILEIEDLAVILLFQSFPRLRKLFQLGVESIGRLTTSAP